MVQIVEIRQRGFSVRYPHNEFVAKYGPIVGRGPDQPGCQGPMEGMTGPAAWRDESERVGNGVCPPGFFVTNVYHMMRF